MRRSKLEIYQDVLDGLKDEPLTVDRLSYETGMDCTVLKKRLDFLIENGLVKEKVLKKGLVFAVSERGFSVLKALDVQKHLDKVKKAMTAVDRSIWPEITVHKRWQENE